MVLLYILVRRNLTKISTAAQNGLTFTIIVGCLCLPFVWAVNTIWFFDTAFKKPPFDEQPQIRKYVIWSAIGSTIWSVLLVAWIVIFQTQRVKWGVTGDALSFIVPLGRA